MIFTGEILIPFFLNLTIKTILNFRIFTDIVNGLQGFLNFIVLVVWRKRIRKELAGKNIFCFKGPDKWSDLKDSEEEELNPEESQMVGHHKHPMPLP